MIRWFGIRTNTRLYECERILVSFGYKPIGYYNAGYLWINVVSKTFQYSNVDPCQSIDELIDQEQLAEKLLLTELGVNK